jgi:hypothetical protein
VGGVQLGAGAIELHNNLFFESYGPPTMGAPAMSPTEHVNWNLDETDDGQDQGFLVFASEGNLYFPSATDSGEPRPAPAAVVSDQDPRLGELVDDAFPPYLPLLAGSPAVDAGQPRPGVTVDMRGEARDAAPDIGAFELVP